MRLRLLTGGKIYSISLYASTEGLASTGSRSKLGRILTSIAGYPFASAVSFLLMYLLVQKEYDMICYIFAGFIVVNLVLWVRNLYGIVWLLIFGAMVGSILYFDYPSIEIFAIKVFVAIIFSEAIYTAVVIFILSIKDKQNAGDAKNLAKSTFIPTAIWGVLFMAQAFYFGYLGIQLWF